MSPEDVVKKLAELEAEQKLMDFEEIMAERRVQQEEKLFDLSKKALAIRQAREILEAVTPAEEEEEEPTPNPFATIPVSLVPVVHSLDDMNEEALKVCGIISLMLKADYWQIEKVRDGVYSTLEKNDYNEPERAMIWTIAMTHYTAFQEQQIQTKKEQEEEAERNRKRQEEEEERNQIRQDRADKREMKKNDIAHLKKEIVGLNERLALYVKDYVESSDYSKKHDESYTNNIEKTRKWIADRERKLEELRNTEIM